MSGVPFARIEFLDEHQVRAVNNHSKLGLVELPTLFLEFHGSESGRQRAVRAGASRGGDPRRRRVPVGGRAPRTARGLWRARHLSYFSALALRPGCQSVVADVCVPVSALAECVERARAEIDKAGLVAPILGHVGDGNFHVIFLPMPDAAAEHEAVTRVYDAMVAHALELGGTCTGEHGIGLGKKKKLLSECGADVVGLMQAIKQAWDPNSILNPGKIFGN
jgi:D-lactate dehydrogenase (cytochrome)